MMPTALFFVGRALFITPTAFFFIFLLLRIIIKIIFYIRREIKPSIQTYPESAPPPEFSSSPNAIAGRNVLGSHLRKQVH